MGSGDVPSMEITGETDNTEQASGMDVIGEADVLTPLDEALLEAGKALVRGALAQSYEFHKTMLGLTATFSTLMTTAYGVLVIGGLTTSKQLDNLQRILLVVPVVLMLGSSLFFAAGYFPREMEISLDDICDLLDVHKKMSKILKTRRRWAIGGGVLFALSIVCLLGSLAFLNIR